MNTHLEGTLFEYDKERNLICYFNNIKAQYNVILVGGLMFNILSLPYTQDLASYCKDNKLGFYIPQFRSHPNYGIYTIENDIEDLSKLINLIESKIILIGNSTGCQVIMKFIQNSNKILLCFLQGPVSDVEYEENINNRLEENITLAERTRGVLPFLHEGNYISSERYLSLFKRNGTEDLFSSYLEDNFLKKLNPNGVRCVFIVSLKDEYVIKSNKEKLSKIRNSVCYEIKEGDHFLVHDRYLPALGISARIKKKGLKK